MKDVWTFIGKLKLVLSQTAIYFSAVSMVAILVTLWHTTISPILETKGYHPEMWWLVVGIVVIFGLVIAAEWNRSTQGFVRSWTVMFWAEDNPMRLMMEAHTKAHDAQMKALRDELQALRRDLRK